MKQYTSLFLYCLLFTFSVALAQEEKKTEDHTIKGQFEKVLETSNNYQNYKIVSKEKLTQLQKSVMDSIAKQQQRVDEKNQTIASNTEEISKLKLQISDLESDLATVQQQKESMDIFGISIQKTVYSLLMWTIVGILTALLAWYVLRFSKGNVVTKKSVRDLEELQKEYDEHRKTALEREQKVRRQLQDEINKSRGI